ncbi:MAG: hypothetical protein E6X43_04180 [Peptostreptococcaceae bacterium]|nr:hypothetical protein [Peptostreptococcaceae bacterium]
MNLKKVIKVSSIIILIIVSIAFIALKSIGFQFAGPDTKAKVLIIEDKNEKK